ncbi:unnamed protein product [Caenorhabditis auriculariae]|uniref:RNA helicase n=1 Tax=Caenorhabditis auriculariae TaxID=2777116 RepID=A0A8S1GTB1_9PELO|nr:unnamed protein product [Caenorhabditis auriculariae]
MNTQFYAQQQQPQQNGWPAQSFGQQQQPQQQTNGFANGGQTNGFANGPAGGFPPQGQANGFGNGFNSPPVNGYGQFGAVGGGFGHQQQQQNGVAPQNGFASRSESDNQAGYITKGFGGYNPNLANGTPINWSNQANGSESMEKQLFNRTSSGINFDNYENIPVDVSGENPPEPINDFAEANFHEWIKENVEKSGYAKPTPVQKHSIPTLLGNRDLMSCAQTGSGKTAAFLLPIINHILNNGPDAVKQATTATNGRRTYFPSALVLSPTRELAIQIHKEAAKFSYRTNIVTAILYGGRENYREQVNRLRGGCHILIATPGRLIDIIEQGWIGLAGCQYLVLDEADRMLDMGFEPQIRKIVNNGMPPKTNRITAMFSATFPKQIQVLAKDFLKPDYVFLAVGRVGSTSENIEQHLLWVEEIDKRRTLMQIIEQDDRSSLVLIFVETKRGANELAFYLNRQNCRAVSIHGDLKQFEREKNLELFRHGTYPILVATAVAARGLDIPNVRHVINYDLPNDVDEYVHRIGRTGRCGNVGKATSFFNDKNRGIGRELMQLVQESNQEVPDFLRRVAAEGRINIPRQPNRRFGGVDHRRGVSTRPGQFNNSYIHGANGIAAAQGFNNGFSIPANGFGMPRPMPQNGFMQNGMGGFPGARGGFSNPSMGRGGMNGGFSNGFSMQRMNGFGQPPFAGKQQPIDHWQAPAN